MKQPLNISVILLIGIMAIFTPGCAEKEVVHSGFIDNYPVLSPGPNEGADFVFIKEGVSFAAYNKILMDHVVFYLAKDSDYKGIQTDELNELAKLFHQAFIDELAGSYEMVKKPGPGVLRIRTALTDLVPSKPGLSGVTTIIPIGLAVSLMKSSAGGGHTGVGNASVEAEFLDSVTNERLAVAIDTRLGDKLEGLTKWGAVKGAFEFWAKRLHVWLDNAK